MKNHMLPKGTEILLQQKNKKYDLGEAERFIATSAVGADSSVVSFLNFLFPYAARIKASDIHFRDQENGCMVRIRHQNMELENVWLLSRLASQGIDTQIRAKCKIGSMDRESPQDGSFWILSEDEQLMIDVRVSIIPTKFGQNIACRILDQSNSGRTLDTVYMPDNVRSGILNILSSSQGMILISGPTGSGKTSTLYSFLNYLNRDDVHIMTAEDPVEYRMIGANQVNINRHYRSFDKVLRSFLRQDPDIILVGEIRDLETATTAVSAANTGHLLFSTIHANNAAATITRLVGMGVERYALADSLIAFLAQRLLNKLCPKCRIKKQLTQKEREMLPENSRHFEYFFQKNKEGCINCKYTGIQGRIPVIEFAINTTQVRSAILKNDHLGLLQALRVQETYRTLTESALQMSYEGLVDIDDAMSQDGDITDVA